MGNPLVSVSLPTYNQAQFVGDSIASVAEQDYDNLEVIVADDGSTDETPNIIVEYAKKYPGRVIPIIGGPNLGVTGNSNRSFLAVRGKYVALSAGDDLYLPGKIRKQVDWLEADEQRVLCGHDVEYFDSTSGKTLYRWSDIKSMRQGDGAADIVKYSHPFHSLSYMIRATNIPASGYDKRMPVASDLKLAIDCMANGGRFGYIEGVLARYRAWQGNVTKDRTSMVRDQLKNFEIIDKEYPHFRKQNRYRRSQYFRTRAYKLLLEENDPGGARRLYLDSLNPELGGLSKSIFGLFLTFLPLQFTAAIKHKVLAIRRSMR